MYHSWNDLPTVLSVKGFKHHPGNIVPHKSSSELSSVTYHYCLLHVCTKMFLLPVLTSPYNRDCHYIHPF